jgi:pilus assembly protein CpaF
VATADDHASALAAELRVELVERRRADAAAGRQPEYDLPTAVERLVDEQAAVLSDLWRVKLTDLILRDTIGLGPLEELLADPEVEELMVNGPDVVYVERRGKIEPADVRFESERALRDAIERILAPVGRRVDELNPMADARLADGSRVNVVIPPLAIDGPTLCVRRFTAVRPDPDELVAGGTLTPELAASSSRGAPDPERRHC